MGKIFRGAEVTRIYVGSFKEGALERPEFQVGNMTTHNSMENAAKLDCAKKVSSIR
jgi:hypothetical protein